MIIWQKYPLTLEPWWVDPLTKHLSSFHLHHLHHKHMALSLSQLRHAFLDTSRWNLQSRDPHWSLPNQSGSYGFQWRSGWLWRRILQQHIFCFLLFRDPPIWPNQFYCEWSKKYLPWRKHQKATWHGLPMGDGGLQVSPKTTNAQLFVLRAPAFFPFNSISCLVMSTPQRFCSKSPLGWGQNGSNRGGHYLIIKTSHSWRRYHWIEMLYCIIFKI